MDNDSADISVQITCQLQAPAIDTDRLETLTRDICRQFAVAHAVISIAIVDDKGIIAVNRRFLDRTTATDVISFDLSDPGQGLSAQIIVCAEVAVREARVRRIGPQRELMLYIVHGLLHVMGYDDTSPQLAEKMYARQEELLEAFLSSRRR